MRKKIHKTEMKTRQRKNKIIAARVQMASKPNKMFRLIIYQRNINLNPNETPFYKQKEVKTKFLAIPSFTCG